MGLLNRNSNSDVPFADGYESDVVLGVKYRDKHSDFEGIATGVFFYENGCIRVLLEGGKDGDPKEHVVDEQRLIEVESAKPVESSSPRGGPRSAPRSYSR